MADAKKLRVIIDGETYELEQALKKGADGIDDFGKQAKKSGSMFKQMGAEITAMLPALGLATAVAGAKALLDLQDEVVRTRSKIQQLTGATGDELTELTSKMQAMANTFGVEFDELTTAANNFSKTMGIDMTESLDMIADGFLSGANASGEFLPMLAEYGTNFKEAGLAADEAIALMSQSVKSGIFSDKGADVIKEGTLRLREMTQSTRDALAGIGIDADEMTKKLRSGQMSYFEAMQMVSGKLSELDAQSPEVGTAIADIFGGPGEDAGLGFLTTLKDINLNLAQMKEEAGGNAEQQARLLAAETKYQEALNKQLGEGASISTEIKIGWKNMLGSIIAAGDKIVYFIKNFTPFGWLMRGLIFSIKTAFDVLKAGVELATQPIIDAWNWIVDTMQPVIDIAYDVGDAISNAFSWAATPVQNLWNKIRGTREELADLNKELKGTAAAASNAVKAEQGWSLGYDFKGVQSNFGTKPKPTQQQTTTTTPEQTLATLEEIQLAKDELEMSDLDIQISPETEQAQESLMEFFDQAQFMADGLNQALAGAMDNFSDALVDAIMNGENFGEAMANIMKQLLADVIRVLIKAIILQAVMAAFTGGASAAAGGRGLFKALGGNLTTGLPNTANGGIAMTPQVRMVGEAGPEAIIPLHKMNNQQTVIVKGEISNNVIRLSNKEGENRINRLR